MFFTQHHLVSVLQEMWATDSNKVQEFMFSYLKDPLREVEQPYFHLEEVPSQLVLTKPILTQPIGTLTTTDPLVLTN